MNIHEGECIHGVEPTMDKRTERGINTQGRQSTKQEAAINNTEATGKTQHPNITPLLKMHILVPK